MENFCVDCKLFHNENKLKCCKCGKVLQKRAIDDSIFEIVVEVYKDCLDCKDKTQMA